MRPKNKPHKNSSSEETLVDSPQTKKPIPKAGWISRYQEIRSPLQTNTSSEDPTFHRQRLGKVKGMIPKILVLLARLYKKVVTTFRRYDWALNAREEQKEPEGNWRTWLIMAGRGFGKTRTGAETVRHWIDSGKCKHVAIVAKSLKEARQVMVEGDSGLLNVYPENARPRYYPSKRLIVWPNGAKVTLYSGDRPDQFRGPQFDGAWVDEFAKYRDPEETYNQLNLALRLGDCPQLVITTTPRPLKILEKLVEEAETSDQVILTQGTTYDNLRNLAPGYADFLKTQYEGTLLGAQEVRGELLSMRDSALWKRALLDQYRFSKQPMLNRVVIGIDPAATNTATSDETGIVVAGVDDDGKAYILEDLSGKYSPGDWAKQAIRAYHHYKADRIVAETNKGGDMVEDLLRAHDPTVSFKPVRATRGKMVRAEPVAALYEKGCVYHRERGLDRLEQQMMTYVPGRTSKSPDRIDALVWTLTELMLRREADITPHAWIIQ